MKKLTTSQVATRLGVGKSTVNLWCNQGKFPNAESVEESRGPVWLIPETDLNGFEKPKAGRPPKSSATEKAATGQIQRSNGRSPVRKAGKK